METMLCPGRAAWWPSNITDLVEFALRHDDRPQTSPNVCGMVHGRAITKHLAAPTIFINFISPFDDLRSGLFNQRFPASIIGLTIQKKRIRKRKRKRILSLVNAKCPTHMYRRPSNPIELIYLIRCRTGKWEASFFSNGQPIPISFVW